MAEKQLSVSTSEGIAEALKDLRQHVGYRYLSAVIQEQVDELQRDITQHPVTPETVYVQEFKKGLLMGKLSYEDLIDTILAGTQYDIRRKHEQRDTDDE